MNIICPICKKEFTNLNSGYLWYYGSDNHYHENMLVVGFVRVDQGPSPTFTGYRFKFGKYCLNITSQDLVALYIDDKYVVELHKKVAVESKQDVFDIVDRLKLLRVFS